MNLRAVRSSALAIAGSLFFAAPVFFLTQNLLSPEVFFMRDLTYLFHPWRSLSAQMIQSGQFPLWNAYQMGGMPFLANCQSAILYPFTLFFVFFEFAIGLKLFHFFHYALAGFGFYLAAKKMGLGQLASLFCGIVFAYNGYLLTRAEFLSVLGSAIWFPWILLAGLSVAEGGGVGSAIALALTLCLSFFAGYPQVFILQALGLMLLLLFKVRDKGALLWTSAAFLIFLAASAAQWGPTLELISNSVRGGKGVPFKEAATYSLPVDSLFGLVYPFRILNNPDRFTGEKFFWIWSAWWGFGASLLVLAAPFNRLRKWGGAAAALAGLGLWWSMGDQLPGYEFIYQHIFVVRLFRYPPVLLYWTVVGIALLAALGVESLKASKWMPMKWVALGLIVFSTLELQHYSPDLLPTIDPEYYHVKFPAVAQAQENPGFALLSPKVNQVRRFAGNSSYDARLKFRSMLFDLTNLPYRIKTIQPAGEPLALRSYRALYTVLTSAPKLEDARPIANAWNIGTFIGDGKLNSTWEEQYSDESGTVYRNTQAYGETYAVERPEAFPLPSEITRPISVYELGDRAEAFYDAPKDLWAVFDFPNYPGWKAFCPGCPSHGNSSIGTSRAMNHFLSFPLPRGNHHLYLLYDPWTWKLGCAASLLALSLIFLWAVRSCKP